jgi:hypothetical protein
MKRRRTVVKALPWAGLNGHQLTVGDLGRDQHHMILFGGRAVVSVEISTGGLQALVSDLSNYLAEVAR